jgi:hypothetical protein
VWRDHPAALTTLLGPERARVVVVRSAALWGLVITTASMVILLLPRGDLAGVREAPAMAIAVGGFGLSASLIRSREGLSETAILAVLIPCFAAMVAMVWARPPRSGSTRSAATAGPSTPTTCSRGAKCRLPDVRLCQESQARRADFRACVAQTSSRGRKRGGTGDVDPRARAAGRLRRPAEPARDRPGPRALPAGISNFVFQRRRVAILSTIGLAAGYAVVLALQ